MGRAVEVEARAVPRLGHLPELDGLRGVAVLLVVAYHALANRIATLSSGLDLFFVLSGFLITTLLLEEHASTGSVRLGDFFRRRALRLLPALVAYLGINLAMAAAGSLGVPTLAGVWDLRTVGVEAAAALAYASPVVLALWEHPEQLRLPHLHSLSQEEWFYALWAPAVARAWRRDRWPRLVVAVAVVVALLAVGRIALVLVGEPALVGPLRPDAMFVGALVAVARRRWLAADATPPWIRRWALVVAWLGTLGFVAANAGGWLDGDRIALAAVTGTRLAAVFPLLVMVAAGPTDPLRRLLAAPPLQWLGRRSYGVYLWHVTILIWVNGGAELVAGTDEIRVQRPVWLLAVAALGGGVVAAWASWHLVERRFLRLARRYRVGAVTVDGSHGPGARVGPPS